MSKNIDVVKESFDRYASNTGDYLPVNVAARASALGGAALLFIDRMSYGLSNLPSMVPSLGLVATGLAINALTHKEDLKKLNDSNGNNSLISKGTPVNIE